MAGPEADLTATPARRPGLSHAVAASAALHLALLAAVAAFHDRAEPHQARFVPVTLAPAPRPAPLPPPASPAADPEDPAPLPSDATTGAAAEASPAEPAPAPPAVAERASEPATAIRTAVAPSGARGDGGSQTASLGAATVADAGGSGARAGQVGGGACDMALRLQDALRQDADIRAAVAKARVAAGRALLVWDGDWTRTPSEAGKGLAGVRQAIALEVAFAPPACKTAPMQGVVFIAVSDAPGAARIALGDADWRWTDLLGLPAGR